MVEGGRRRLAPSRRRGWVALGAVTPVLLAAIAWRASSERLPPLTLRPALADQIAIPGHALRIAWPREGEASVEVEGIGSFGVHGRRSPVPIASVAKVMTAYLTLQEHPLPSHGNGFMLTVTRGEVAEERRREADDQSIVPVKRGERISELKALQALLLPSANNIAAMLARYDARSIPAFVARMNKAATALHMTSTRYTDPSGFRRSTVSTPTDQLKLAQAALRIPALAAIVAMPTTKLPVAGKVGNIDGLVAGDDGYIGVKTGSDSAAGGCLMFAKRLTVDGRRLRVLGVVLGQRHGPFIPAALASARRLGDSAAAAVGLRTALKAAATIFTVRSVDGQRTTAVAAHTVREIGWPGLRIPVRVDAKPSRAPLSVGQQLGSATLGDGATTATTVSAVTASRLDGPSIGWRLAHLL